MYDLCEFDLYDYVKGYAVENVNKLVYEKKLIVHNLCKFLDRIIIY